MKIDWRGKKKGFTLIEILVVVSIIAILSSVVLSALNSARSKGRNAARSSDIRQLANAFNLAYNSTNSFPIPVASPTDNVCCISTYCFGNWAQYAAQAPVDAFFAPYIAKLTDAQSGNRSSGGYLYWVTTTDLAGPYDGTIFPKGVYILYADELPQTTISCAPGKIYAVKADFIKCMYKLD